MAAPKREDLGYTPEPNVNDVHTILGPESAFEGKLAQYIGRIRGAQKTVYDYHDISTPFLDRQFKKRKKFYKENGFVIS